MREWSSAQRSRAGALAVVPSKCSSPGRGAMVGTRVGLGRKNMVKHG
jgi:hypothetical protein